MTAEQLHFRLARYSGAIIGVWEDKSLIEYYAVAATCDLVVHNSGLINELYLQKAGKKARGDIGDRLTVDRKYFYGALVKFKRVSGAIKHDVEKKYHLA